MNKIERAGHYDRTQDDKEVTQGELDAVIGAAQESQGRKLEKRAEKAVSDVDSG